MPVWDMWLKKMESKGLPGKEVMDLFKKLLAKRGIVVKSLQNFVHDRQASHDLV